jgi:ubiquinone biosynthesis protein COQ9
MSGSHLPALIGPRLLRPVPVCPSCYARHHRSYYSSAYPDPPPFPPAEAAILSAALHHVPRHGFTATALSLGAKDAGYLDVSVQLFPKGAFDLIHYYLVMQRLGLKNRLHFPEETKLGVAAKVRALAWARLLANKEIVHQWQGVSALDRYFSRTLLLVLCRCQLSVFPFWESPMLPQRLLTKQL